MNDTQTLKINERLNQIIDNEKLRYEINKLMT